MVGRWLVWLNCIIGVLIVLLLAGTAMMRLQRPKEIRCSDPISKHCGLPKGAFAREPEAYTAIASSLLELQSVPPSLQLPDLRQHLIYYGKNGRPDAHTIHTFLHFSLSGNKTVVSIAPGERLYLLYDKKSAPSHYVFSPTNQETSLWIEAVPQDNEAFVKVFMKTDKGELIVEPEQYAQFKLPEKEFIRYAGAAWEIGAWRVDGTLLARQRARWFGGDCFLEKHGGEDYQHVVGKQRIDFGENEDLYSVFVGIGDCLIWNGKQWQAVSPGEDSLKHPLLMIKKIDERLMSFELWDVEGKGKVVLNLLKSTEPWTAHHAHTIQNTFKFVGARTRTQCVFEINHERMLVSPADWLLFTPKGWKKLETEEDIDHYVKRKLSGMLFVFGGLARKEDRQVMLGTLYNPSRSDFQEVEIPIQGGVVKSNAKENEMDEKAASAALKSELESLLPTMPNIPNMPALPLPPTHPQKDQPSTR